MGISKLIIVDGIAGAGKTTTCRWLVQQLQQRALAVRAIYEADVPHPLHWWAYWDGAQHQAPDFAVAPASSMAASLERWQQFIAQLGLTTERVIIEGPLYCLAVWFFLQADAHPQQITAYIEQVEAIIAPVAPLLIYLRQERIAEHSRRVWDSRGSAIEHELIAHLERTPYLRHRQLSGFAGAVALWQATQALTDELFAAHHVPKLAIEVTAAQWDSSYQRILAAVMGEGLA